jgi:membrane associated rhomboid family serine protease
MRNLWDSMGLFSRFILISTTAVYFAGLLLPSLNMWLVCSPALIGHFQVWRLLTGLFVHPQFLMLLFSVVSYVPQISNVEQ